MSNAFRNTATVDGASFTRVGSQDFDAGFVFSKSIGPAKTGSLTTRTNATDGTLTMAASHGITTGARLDLYWDGGMRRGITVGTVSINSVPISAGLGDDLPAQATAITAMVPNHEFGAAVGNDITGVFLACDNAIEYAQFTFMTVVPAEIVSVAISPAEDAFIWNSDSGTTYAGFSGATVASVWLSHGDSTAARVVRGKLMYS